MDAASDSRSLADATGDPLDHVAEALPASSLLAGPVLRPLLRLAAPTMLVMLVQVIIGVAEAYYISFLGTQALAGATLVFPFHMLMTTMSAGGLGSGVASATARARGAGREADVQAILFHALLVSIGVGALFSAVMLMGGPRLYASLGGEGATLAAALRYSTPLFIGAIAMWTTNLLAAALRGLGNAVLPAKITLAGAMFLIPASPALIFGFGPVPALGIAGAGWSITLYYVGASVALLRYIARAYSRVGYIGKRISIPIFADIFKVGLPSSLNAVQNSLATMILTALAARFGVDALAAYGIASRLDATMVPILFGIASAVLTMVGMNVGADNIQRAKHIAWAGTMIGLVLVGVPGLLFAVWPRLWLGLFTVDPTVLAEGALYLHITGPSYALLAIAFILSFAAQGAGHALWPSVGVTLRLAIAGGMGWAATSLYGLGFAALAAAVVAGLCAYAATCIVAMLSGAVWRRRASTTPPARP